MQCDLFTDKWHLTGSSGCTTADTHPSANPWQKVFWCFQAEKSKTWKFLAGGCHFALFSAKSWAILSNDQKPTDKLGKHWELILSLDSLFHVQAIWEREEDRDLRVYKREIMMHSCRKKIMVYGLQLVTRFLCPFQVSLPELRAIPLWFLPLFQSWVFSHYFAWQPDMFIYEKSKGASVFEVDPQTWLFSCIDWNQEGNLVWWPKF